MSGGIKQSLYVKDKGAPYTEKFKGYLIPPKCSNKLFRGSVNAQINFPEAGKIGQSHNGDETPIREIFS